MLPVAESAFSSRSPRPPSRLSTMPVHPNPGCLGRSFDRQSDQLVGRLIPRDELGAGLPRSPFQTSMPGVCFGLLLGGARAIGRRRRPAWAANDGHGGHAMRTNDATTERPGDVLVIFGITGDLARVMTFRSLYRLEQRGLLDCP